MPVVTYDMSIHQLSRVFRERLAESTVAINAGLTGAENMRRDVELAEQLLQSPHNSRIAIRFYRWQPWCISLGKTQSASDIDHGRAAADGIDVVRRPTGGRAILHAQELTYALAMRLSDGLTHAHVYQFWHEWLSAVLRLRFGIQDIVFARTPADFPFLLRHGEPTRWMCFASSARSELLWRGRKLVGSAQRLYGDVLLQHGSVLLDRGHERLPYYLRGCTDPASAAALLERRSVTLTEICQRPIPFEELSAVLCDALRNTPMLAG